jgi:hypothetical protein
MTEDSSLFGAPPRADTLRSASATRGDAAVLALAANSGNFSLTEASISRISVQIDLPELREYRRILKIAD